MKVISILLLLVFAISCSTKKNIQRSNSEVQVSTETQKVQQSSVDSTKLVKEAVIITTEEDSGYTREVVEEISEVRAGDIIFYGDPEVSSTRFRGQIKAAGNWHIDSNQIGFPDADHIPQDVIVRLIKRTIREKGQKTSTTTTQANNSDSTHVKKDHQQQEVAKVDSAASSEEVKKDVKRNGLNWYGWVFVILVILGLILYYRPSLLKAWRWILYRLFGHKP